MKTILFLCPHNAAKSVIAAAYFNQAASAAGLAWRADSAGTEPSEHVGAIVVKMLAEDGLDVSGYQPRKVTPLELQSVDRMISIGCTPDELSGAAKPVEYWDDVPMVSQDAQGSREAIRQHVTTLVQSLSHG